MNDTAPAGGPETSEPLPGERGTRLSGAWTAIVIGLLALVVILVAYSRRAGWGARSGLC